MKIKSKVRRRQPPRSEMVRLLDELARTCENPTRLVELYYWSREPDLAEIMRQIVSIPEDARNALHVFFRLTAENPSSVSINVSTNGDVVLSSSMMDGLLTAIETSIKEKGIQPLH